MLDAFLTCAARYGIEGATLERIAAEAGLKRPLIRHHLGNRDDMIAALAEHILTEIDNLTEATREALKDYPSAQGFIDILFSEEAETDPRLTLVFQSLAHSADAHPELRAELVRVMQSLYDLARDAMALDYPGASLVDRATVGQAIVDLYLSQDSLSPLQPPSDWRRNAYLAATRLARSLSGS